MEQKDEQSMHIRQAVALYSAGLIRLAFTYLRNVQDAEDAVQEVFLAFLRGMSALQGEEHEKAWLIRATINRCKNHLKSSWLRNRRPMPDDLSYMMEEDSGILRAVMALDEKYRLPIHLHYYEGYAIKEIARLLGDNPATVGTRLARGRELLKSTIGGIWDA